MQENILKQLYDLSAKLKPVLDQLGARLLTVSYEWEGRKLNFSFDDVEFPVGHVTGSPVRDVMPPPIPTDTPPASNAPVADYAGGVPPLPPPPPWQQEASMSSPWKQPELPGTSDGLPPLTDEDNCPVGKQWKGMPLKDVEAGFLLWVYEQPWCRQKFSRLCDYIDNCRNVLEQEAEENRRNNPRR